jgi:transcription elongation GreA/GreB family factor
MATSPIAAFGTAIVGASAVPRVHLGCRVHVRFEDGEELTFTLGLVADPGAGIISLVSPLGSALRDACAGDLVRYLTPTGLVVATVLGVDLPAGSAAP